MTDLIYVSLVEDDDEIRDSLALLINSREGFKCISSFSNCEDALKKLPSDPPDVVLMDISLPGMTGIEGVKRLREKLPNVDVLMLTVHKDDDLVFQSLCAGAVGYLMKNTLPDRLLDSIKEVYEGGAPMSTNIARRIVTSFHPTTNPLLTQRETEVLSQLCKGQSYKMIADTLIISEETIHFHIKNIYKKLQVHSKSEAVAKAIKEKLV
ncbi:MAG: response regulator transcription factor [Ignavibacteriaceae bacterium]